MDLHLKDHVAVVTGGASGIGRATASAFAEEGANVAIWDLSPQTPEVAEQLAQQFGVPTLAVSVDITNEAAVREAAEKTILELQALDHLVHAAAIGSGKFGFPFTNLQPQD